MMMVPVPPAGIFLALGKKDTKEANPGEALRERPDRRRWRDKEGERVAAVGKTQARIDEQSGCRAPQQCKLPQLQAPSPGNPTRSAFSVKKQNVSVQLSVQLNV